MLPETQEHRFKTALRLISVEQGTYLCRESMGAPGFVLEHEQAQGDNSKSPGCRWEMEVVFCNGLCLARHSNGSFDECFCLTKTQSLRW
jgi:hypothetical protein